MGSWDGKVAIITGAASGIGRATARRFAGLGATVVVGDFDERQGQETVRLIKEAGGNATFTLTDVTSDGDVRRLITGAAETYGGVHLLHNNVGIIRRHMTIDAIPIEDFRRTIDVNLTSYFVASQAVAPVMRAQGGGVIVNTASMAAVVPVSVSLSYATAKAGLLGLTRSMAVLLQPDGILVNAVCPGQVDTPLIRDRESGQIAKRSADGLLQPDDIAQAVEFLANAAGVTGRFISVRQTPDGPRMFWINEHQFEAIET